MRTEEMILPEAFRERMRWMLDGTAGTPEDETRGIARESDAFFTALQEESCRALRMNPLKRRLAGHGGGAEDSALDASDFREEIFDGSRALTGVPWEKNGYYYDAALSPGRHPYHEAGVYYIQEPSAMAPVAALRAEPGERVLDLCAAPGGKSTQLAAAMCGRGLLVCNETHPVRVKALSENIERMGIRNALVLNEEPARLAERFPEYFDRILVDAPCSGEGMFRRNEEAVAEWSEENVARCAARQDEILDQAYRMLREGGLLCYSTCTFAPLEDEGSISRMIRRHPDMRIEEIPRAGGYSSGRPDWITLPAEGIERTVRLWPHLVRGEGHYVALLSKGDLKTDPFSGKAVLMNESGAGLAGSGTNRARGGKHKARGSRTGLASGQTSLLQEAAMPEAFFAFSDAVLRPEAAGRFRQCYPMRGERGETGRYLAFGDQLYLAPEGCPSLQGLRVKRPGLHLGTVRKNRFEPSHALAHSLDPNDVQKVCDLRAPSFLNPRDGAVGSDQDPLKAYLKGESFPYDAEKGWYLICADGYSIGWGKLSDGMMKNHYPKGLRRPL